MKTKGQKAFGGSRGNGSNWGVNHKNGNGEHGLAAVGIVHLMVSTSAYV